MTTLEDRLMRVQQPTRLFLDSRTRTNAFQQITQADITTSNLINVALQGFGIVTNQLYDTDASDHSSQCVYQLDTVIFKPLGVRVLTAVIPNTFSTFKEDNKILTIATDRANFQYGLTLPTDIRYASYTVLKDELNQLLTAAAGTGPSDAFTDLNGITFDADDNIGRLVVTNGTAHDIALLQNTNLGLTYPLVIAAGATATAGSIMLLNPYRSLFIRANFTGLGTLSSVSSGDILAEVPVNTGITFGDNIVYEANSAAPIIPVTMDTVSEVEILLTDFDGKLIDLKGKQWTLELGFVYDSAKM